MYELQIDKMVTTTSISKLHWPNRTARSVMTVLFYIIFTRKNNRLVDPNNVSLFNDRYIKIAAVSVLRDTVARVCMSSVYSLPFPSRVNVAFGGVIECASRRPALDE